MCDIQESVGVADNWIDEDATTVCHNVRETPCYLQSISSWDCNILLSAVNLQLRLQHPDICSQSPVETTKHFTEEFHNTNGPWDFDENNCLMFANQLVETLKPEAQC